MPDNPTPAGFQGARGLSTIAPNKLTVVGGAAWLPGNYAAQSPSAPAGFQNFPSIFGYFFNFTAPPFIGAVAFYIPPGAMGPIPYGPQFGIKYQPGPPLNGWANFGFLYLPIGLAGHGRTYLTQYIPSGLALGKNINPLLTPAQISANSLQYVAISLNSAQQPQSALSARINFNLAMTVNLTPVNTQLG